MTNLRPSTRKRLQLIGIGCLIFGLLIVLFCLFKPKKQEPAIDPVTAGTVSTEPVTDTPVLDTQTSEEEPTQVEEAPAISDITGEELLLLLEAWTPDTPFAYIICTSDMIVGKENYDSSYLTVLTTDAGIAESIQSDTGERYSVVGINYGTALSGMTICAGEQSSYYSMGGFLEEPDGYGKELTNPWTTASAIHILAEDTFVTYDIKDVDDNLIGQVFVPTEIKTQEEIDATATTETQDEP